MAPRELSGSSARAWIGAEFCGFPGAKRAGCLPRRSIGHRVVLRPPMGQFGHRGGKSARFEGPPPRNPALSGPYPGSCCRHALFPLWPSGIFTFLRNESAGFKPWIMLNCNAGNFAHWFSLGLKFTAWQFSPILGSNRALLMCKVEKRPYLDEEPSAGLVERLCFSPRASSVIKRWPKCNF